MNHAVVEDYLSELMAADAPPPAARAPEPVALAAPAPDAALRAPSAAECVAKPAPIEPVGPVGPVDPIVAAGGEHSVEAPAPPQPIAAPAAARAPREEPRTEPEDADDAPARRRRAADQVTTWLRFRVGPQACAVEVLRVQEVLRVPEIVPVRGAPSHVIGLMNLRGQLVAVLDLARRLGLDAPPWSPTDESRVIVLEHGGQALGLRVDAVADVARIAGSAVERVRGPLLGASGEVLRGVARIDGATIVLLDAVALLD